MLGVRRAEDPEFGEIVAVDHPIAIWKAWTFIGLVGFLMGGWLFVLPEPPWLGAITMLAVSIVLAMFIFGERILIEQRLYERALVSRSLVPFVGIYVLPYATIDPETIRLTPTFRWTDEGERHLPAARALRCKPWGRVLRLHGPDHVGMSVLRRRGNLVPRDALDLTYSHSSVQEWIFSFTDLEGTERLLRDLIAAEAQRIGPTGFSDPRRTSP